MEIDDDNNHHNDDRKKTKNIFATRTKTFRSHRWLLLLFWLLNEMKRTFQFAWTECIWPGLGLFGESYLLFSIGTLLPLWEVVFTDCFVTYVSCSPSLKHTISTFIVMGIICGMITLGIVANTIGRRCGSIVTATFMFCGSWGITIVSCLPFQVQNNNNNNTEFLFSCMIVLLFIFGIGVGGEYPISASSASERAMYELQQRQRQEEEKENQAKEQNHAEETERHVTSWKNKSNGRMYDDDDENDVLPNNHVVKNFNYYTQQHDDNDDDTTKEQSHQQSHQRHQHRGRRIQLVFTMQGMGILCNCMLMTLLLVLTGQTGNVSVVNNNNNNNDDHDDNDTGTKLSVSGTYDTMTLVRIWRITYGIGATVLSYVLISRILYLQESSMWKDEQQQQQQQDRYRQQQQDQQHENENKDENERYQQQQQQRQMQSPTYDDDDIVIVEKKKCHDDSSSQQQQHHHHQYQPPRYQVGITTTSNNNNDDDDGHNGLQQQQHSDVSSLSVPSVQVNDYEQSISIRHVPSTTQEEDLQSSVITLLLRNYGCRLFGVCTCWFLWDVAFYGNKLFQASFLLALTSSSGGGDERTTLLGMSTAATINALVALCGYVAAAVLIDTVGRVPLQQYGFLFTGILFCSCGFLYESLPPGWLVALYFGSSFFGQCGPNATTFVIPSEIFPTQVRTMCHGIAAASGKGGALLAAIVFSRVQRTTDLFLWSGYASFTAAIVTFLFLPETTDLNLYETDRRWRMILEGRKADYVGEATMPKYLSFWERQKMMQQQSSLLSQPHPPDDSLAHDIA